MCEVSGLFGKVRDQKNRLCLAKPPSQAMSELHTNNSHQQALRAITYLTDYVSTGDGQMLDNAAACVASAQSRVPSSLALCLGLCSNTELCAAPRDVIHHGLRLRRI